MSRAFAHLPERVAIQTPNGGTVHSSGNSMAPVTVACTPLGAAFGPLYLSVPEGEFISVSDLTFLPSDGDGDGGWIIFGSVMAGGPVANKSRKTPTGETGNSAEDTNPPESGKATVTRRQVITLAAATLAAGAVGPKVVSAQGEDTVALNIAEFSVNNLTSPFTVRVLDIVDDVLPPTTELLVDARETRVGKITEPAEGVHLPSSTTGKVSVYLRDSRGFHQLLAWAKSLFDLGDSITYSRTLPKPAAEYSDGTFVRLSDHPALVEPVSESGPDGTELTIGNTRIPHSDEESDEVGSYGVFDNSLVYEVGQNPPNSAEWELTTRLAWYESLQRKYL